MSGQSHRGREEESSDDGGIHGDCQGHTDAELSPHADDLSEMGVAYVTWALEHPGHYAVMWRPRLLSESSGELTRTREQAWTLLSTAVTDGAMAGHDAKAEAYAAFAIVHGLASLWLNDALPLPEDSTALIRQVTQRVVTESGQPGD